MSSSTAGGGSIDVFALKYGLLQFLTAVDAVDHDGVDPSRAVLIVMERRSDIGVLQEVPWAEVHTVSDIVKGPLPFRRLVRQRRYQRAVRRAVGGRPVERLYLGHYSIEMTSVARSLRPKTTTVLDDGTSTAYRSHERAGDLAGGRRSPLSARKELAKRALGVDPRHLRRLRFYTVFRPELVDGDRHDQCELSVFRSKMSAAPADPDLLWLLGTNMAELGHLDDGVYGQIVSAVVSRFRAQHPGGSVQYHPHPRERAEKLDALAATTGIDVVRSADPVEIRYLTADPVPGAGITSFPSSALVTLAKLMPDEAQLSMVRLSDRVTWGPISAAENTVEDHLADRLTVIETTELLGT